MQRNMELVRMILMRIEERPLGSALPPFGIVSYRPEQVRYHAQIMTEDGLIEGFDVATSKSDGLETMPQVLTWKGHEFLDLARNQQRWNQAKGIIHQVGSAPLPVWMKVLNDLLLKELGAVS